MIPLPKRVVKLRQAIHISTLGFTRSCWAIGFIGRWRLAVINGPWSSGKKIMERLSQGQSKSKKYEIDIPTECLLKMDFRERKDNPHSKFLRCVQIYVFQIAEPRYADHFHELLVLESSTCGVDLTLFLGLAWYKCKLGKKIAMLSPKRNQQLITRGH